MPKIFSNIVLLLGVAMSKSCANAPRGPLGRRLRAPGASNATGVTQRHVRGGRRQVAGGKDLPPTGMTAAESLPDRVGDTEDSMARPLLAMRSACKYRQNI